MVAKCDTKCHACSMTDRDQSSTEGRKRPTIVLRAPEVEEIILVLKRLAEVSKALGHFEDERSYRVQAAVYWDRLHGKKDR